MYIYKIFRGIQVYAFIVTYNYDNNYNCAGHT